MDWLKNILQSLPLEKISDILGEIVIWWSQLVKGVPPADLPTYAYIGGAIVVLALWVLVARMLPRPLGGMSWMVLFAVLLAPGTALSDPGLLAPASISVVYAVMMKDTAAAVNNALPILVVLVVGLFIGFVWQLIRGAFESSLDEARRRTAEDTTANMQLATGNYLSSTSLGKRVNEPLPAEVPVAKLPVNTEQINKTPIIAADVSNTLKTSTVKPASRPNLIQQNSSMKETSPKDISLKKDSEVKKKKIEGFYSKKMIEEPAVKITDVKADNIKNGGMKDNK